jgi:hypothetical protein
MTNPVIQAARDMGKDAARAETKPTYNTELTPEGEQFVVPGCERNLAPSTNQLSLF